MSPHIKHTYMPYMLIGISGVVLMILKHDYSWLWVTALFWALISGLGIAVGFHRILSHNSIKLPRWLTRILSVLGCWGGQGSPLSWVAIHRGYHHPKSDTAEDIHSPIHGKWHAFLGWMNEQHTVRLTKAGREMLADPFQIYLHENYSWVLSTSALAIFFIFGPKVMLYGFGIAIMISMTQESVVNLLCHLKTVGYRNFDTKDNSNNLAILGYLCWGQGWHNNHHAHPERFNFGIRWWEFDPCLIFYPLLRLFKR